MDKKFHLPSRWDNVIHLLVSTLHKWNMFLSGFSFSVHWPVEVRIRANPEQTPHRSCKASHPSLAGLRCQVCGSLTASITHDYIASCTTWSQG